MGDREGARLILRKECPSLGPSAPSPTWTGTALPYSSPDTGRGVIPGQIAGLELRRQHARVEDRIRQAEASGLRNLPCRGQEENNAWLAAMLAAADVVCWAKLTCFAGAVARGARHRHVDVTQTTWDIYVTLQRQGPNTPA